MGQTNLKKATRNMRKLIAAIGLPLFKNVRDRINLKLIKTKTFGCGAVALYYEPGKN